MYLLYYRGDIDIYATIRFQPAAYTGVGWAQRHFALILKIALSAYPALVIHINFHVVGWQILINIAIFKENFNFENFYFPTTWGSYINSTIYYLN